jgi:peptide/nickel transport system substrate-binding protein
MKQLRIWIPFLVVSMIWLVSACGGSTPAPATIAPAAANTTAPAAANTTAPSGGATAPAAATTAPVAPTSAPAAGQPVKGGTLVVSHGVNVADTLNQHLSNNTPSRMVAHHVLDTLVTVNPKDGSVQPGLASSWDLSPDGKVFTFHLRQGIKFHDGTPFDAQAVKFNLDYTARPDIKHAFAWQALGGDKYDKTEVVDDNTARVTFKSANVSFLVNLSDGGMGIDSPTAMTKDGDSYGVKSLVGTGPFTFKEWVKGDHVTLVRNDAYISVTSIFKHTGPAYLDQIIYRDVADNATRESALEAGDVQVATLVEPQVGQLQGNKDVQVLTTPKAGTTRMYMMNLGKAPTDDINVRLAMNYAIDKKALLQLPAWSGIGNLGLSPLPANMVPGGDVSSLKQYDYPYDPAKAMQLLEAAGWKVGADGIRVKNGQPLVLDFVTQSTSVSQVEPADAMLRKVGAKLNIRTGDFNFWINTVDKGDYHMTLMSDSGYNGPALVQEFFYSKSPSDYPRYKNAQVDQYIEKASNATTQKEVWDNIMPALAQIMKDAVNVNTWEQLYVYGARANVRDVSFNEIGYPYFYDTWLAK